MADETPAPLSDAEIAMLQLTWERYRHDPMPMFSGDIVGQLLATLAAREAELATCQRDYALLRDEVASPEITRLERENTAYREIVAAVASRASTDARNVATNRRCRECGVVGPEPLTHEPDCLAVQARALLATSTPPATDAAAAQEE